MIYVMVTIRDIKKTFGGHEEIQVCALEDTNRY